MVDIQFKCIGNNRSVVGGNSGHVVVPENKESNFTWPYITTQLNSIIYFDNV